MNKIYQKSPGGRKNAGFTLIELLVVVLIIGILSAVALPQYQVAVAKSRFIQLEVLGDAIYEAEHLHYMANGEYSRNFEDLVFEMPGTVVSPNYIRLGKTHCSLLVGEGPTSEGGTRMYTEVYCQYGDNTEVPAYGRTFFQGEYNRSCRDTNKDDNSIPARVCKSLGGIRQSACSENYCHYRLP